MSFVINEGTNLLVSLLNNREIISLLALEITHKQTAASTCCTCLYKPVNKTG